MRKEREEPSSSINRRARKPFFTVALGAIFLLALAGLGATVFSDSSGVGARFSAPLPSTSAMHLYANQADVAETPEFVTVGETGVLATAPPVAVSPKVLGAIIGEANFAQQNRRELLHYAVEEGDTIKSLSERFGISQNTILWVNELSSVSPLTLGQELVILPVSGALHLVRPADTLSEIALWYQGDAEQIMEANGIASAKDIFVGDFLIIPGGIMPKSLPAGRLTPLANSYFIYPVSRSHKLSQGLHAFNAVDLSNGQCNEPVYSAAGGTVQKVGYHSVAGNHVRVLHPNGVVTFYGHLSGQTVEVGQKVSQGAIVGYTGHTGYTIPAGPDGCHLHFEVRGASNPFVK